MFLKTIYNILELKSDIHFCGCQFLSRSFGVDAMIVNIRSSFLFFFLFFYILMPAFLHSFIESRRVLFLMAGVVFLCYLGLRYYILLRFYRDKKQAFWRQFIDDGCLLFGLVLLYLFEGFVYVESSNRDIPSIRFLLYALACCSIIPTRVSNNRMIQKFKHR